MEYPHHRSCSLNHDVQSRDLDSLWETVREEFELEDRFDDFGNKLELVRENTKFFVEVRPMKLNDMHLLGCTKISLQQQVLHSKRSDRLEVAIIVLIAAELSFEIYDHIPQAFWHFF